MSDHNNGVVVVKHIITGEIRPEKDEPKEREWCWTRIQEARIRNANNKKKCLNEVFQILFESCGVIAFFVFENLLGILFLILGITFLKDCPFRPSIPISLIVYGVFSIVHGIILQLLRWKLCNTEEKKDGFANCARLIILIATIIHIIAWICAVWNVVIIYGEVKTGEEHKNNEKYCNRYLYWISYVVFIVMAIICLVLLMLMCCLCCLAMSAIADAHSPTILVFHHPNQQPSASNQTASVQQPNVANPPGGAPQPNAGSQPTAQ